MPLAAASCSRSVCTLTAFTLALIAGILAWFAYDERNQTIEREYRALESNVHIAEAQVSGLLRNLWQLLDTVAAEQRLLTPAARQRNDEMLAERMRQFPEIRSLVILDATGHVEWSATPKLKGFDASRRDYFQAHLRGPLEHNFYVSRPFVTATGNDLSIAFSAALWDDAGRLAGMVVAGMNPRYFESVLEQVKPAGPGTNATLFNAHGDVIFRLPGTTNRGGDILNIRPNAAVQAHLRSTATISRNVTVSVSDGQQRVVVIKRVGSSGLNVAVGRLYRDVLADWSANLLLRVAIFVFAALALLGLTRRLARTEADLRVAAAAFESSVGMMITDADATILRINDAFTDITGYAAADIVGRKPYVLHSGRHDQTFYQAMWKGIAATGKWQGEVWDRHKDGTVHPRWLTIAAVADERGKITHYVSAYYDITERKIAEARINTLAFFDQLTGLPNRALLLDRLAQAIAYAERSHGYGAILFIDLDHFKIINDTKGHEAGDALLKQVAARIRHCLRDEDTVARLGGDEFVVVLSLHAADAVAAAAGVEMVARKLLSSLAESYAIGETTFRSSASIGATIFRGQEAGRDELLKQADIAMYRAKEMGRNTFCFFDAAMGAQVRERADIEHDLARAVADGQLFLHYQPQVVEDGTVVGAEALVRWQHPGRGLISPAAFIPLAEETGLIVPLGLWVLEAACARLVEWARRPELAGLSVAVNVSAKQFQQPDFVDRVLAVLGATGADPRRLKIELTEGMLFSHVDETAAKMRELKGRGIGFSLDDFGTGYSSLAYLKRFPLDQLKIDQSFVRDVLSDPNDAAIAQTVVALARSLGLSVIAEGVETRGQKDFLAAKGCLAYQGYYFSRPLPAEDFERFVLARTPHGTAAQDALASCR